MRIYKDNGREHGQGLNNFLQGTGVAVADNGRTSSSSSAEEQDELDYQNNKHFC